MSLSKAYNVKSNAARAAAKYGLSRNDLVQVDGGWAFEMAVNEVPASPATDTAAEAATEPAPPAKPKRRTVSEAAANLRKAKAKGRRQTKAKGAPKGRGKMAAIISQLKSRWISVDAILEETGWCSNTFRGVLGAHKIKTGEAFERKRVDGMTYYRIAA